MASAQALWKRIEGVLWRPPVPNAIPGSQLKVVRTDAPAAAEPAPRPKFRLPWGRAARAEMEQRYQRVALVMESLERHFDQQDRRSAQLVGAVEHVARSLSDLTDHQRRNHEALNSINQQLTLTAKHVGSCATAFVELPAAMQAQSESVRGVGRQMESVRASQAELGATLGTFRHAVDALRETGVTQVECLERLHLESHDDRRALQHLIRAQQRRFMTVMIVTAAAAIATVVGSAIVVVMAIQPK